MYGLLDIFGVDEGCSLGLYLIRSYINLYKRGVNATSDGLSSSQSVVMVLPLLRDHLTDDEVKECERIISEIDIKLRLSVESVGWVKAAYIAH